MDDARYKVVVVPIRRLGYPDPTPPIGVERREPITVAQYGAMTTSAFAGLVNLKDEGGK